MRPSASPGRAQGLDVENNYDRAQALRTKAWSVARTDVTVCGGFTPARKAMALVDTAGMRCEVMSWGFTLVSAANFHLMLAFQ